jgi:hypothetical protein
MPGLGAFCVATAIALASIYFLVVSKITLLHEDTILKINIAFHPLL